VLDAGWPVRYATQMRRILYNMALLLVLVAVLSSWVCCVPLMLDEVARQKGWSTEQDARDRPNNHPHD